MRIFLDTNVLVSAYLARGVCADLVRFVIARHRLVTGEVNLAELSRVLAGKFQASPAQIETVCRELRDHEIVPKPSAPSPVAIADPADRWVLASAVAGAVDLLVTGDDDLLAIADQSPISIVNPRGCWERLRQNA